MANKIEKQKVGLRVLACLGLILGLAAIAGGVTLIIFGSLALQAADYTRGGLELSFGILSVIIGLLLTPWGFTSFFTGFALKATKGSIADPSIVKGTVNGKKCPKCGCTNTPDATTCQNCGTPLE